MQLNVNQTLKIKAPLIQSYLILAACFACGVLGSVATWPFRPTNVVPISLVQFAGWIGMTLFLIGSIVAIYAHLRSGPSFIKLSPEGFLDSRLLLISIPWSEVEKLSVSPHTTIGDRAIVIKISDAAWNKLPFPRRMRWARSANRLFGIDGLSIRTAEFNLKFDDLFEIFTAYCNAHGGKVT